MAEQAHDDERERAECARAAGEEVSRLEWVRWAGLFDGPFFPNLSPSFLLDAIYVNVYVYKTP